MHDQIIVAVFPSQRILTVALDHLLEEMALDVQQAAVVIKSKTGKIRVLSDDLSGEEGGLVGGIGGSVIGALATSVLGAVLLPGMNLFAVLALGALLGGLVGWIVGQIVSRMVNFSFARPYVNLIADKLQGGNSALMLHVEDAAALLPRLQDELAPYRAQLVAHLREVQANIANN